MAETGMFRYLVMPEVNPFALIETDADALLVGPYSLTSAEILAVLTNIRSTLHAGSAIVARVHELDRQTSELPDAYLDALFMALVMGLDATVGQAMIDAELSMWGLPGHCFLDGWWRCQACGCPS
jgi:hypothetical protein